MCWCWTVNSGNGCTLADSMYFQIYTQISYTVPLTYIFGAHVIIFAGSCGPDSESSSELVLFSNKDGPELLVSLSLSLSSSSIEELASSWLALVLPWRREGETWWHWVHQRYIDPFLEIPSDKILTTRDQARERGICVESHIWLYTIPIYLHCPLKLINHPGIYSIIKSIYTVIRDEWSPPFTLVVNTILSGFLY